MLNLTNKTLENIVRTSIDDHLLDSGILHPNQWAFQKGISTESLLLLLTESWKKAIEQGVALELAEDALKEKIDAIFLGGRRFS